MLHHVADSPIIRHDVFDVGPSTPYCSLPMNIVLCLNDASSTDSLAEASISAVSTFFRSAVTDHRFAIHDESDNTAARSMITETEVCNARSPPASSRNSHGRFSTLSAKISTLFLAKTTSSVQRT